MHSRLINNYGGLISLMPKYAVILMIFTLAAIGLPGTSGFIGELLILIGVFKKSFLVATIASLGVILSAAYMLWLYRRVIFGKIKNEDLKKVLDLNKSELFILCCLAFPVLLLGFYPQPIINTIDASIDNLINLYNSNLLVNK